LSHLSIVGSDIKPGAPVEAGETIAGSGKSGNAHNISSEEEHVHVQVSNPNGEEINPVDYFNDLNTKSDPWAINKNPQPTHAMFNVVITILNLHQRSQNEKVPSDSLGIRKYATGYYNAG
jgi:hypothetical protein